MEIKRLSPSMTELVCSDGARILFSYETPCAIQDQHGKLFKTDKYFSRTTTQHVQQWLNGTQAQSVNHEVILNFCKGAR